MVGTKKIRRNLVSSDFFEAFPGREGKGDAIMRLLYIKRFRNYVHPKRVAEDVDPYGLERHFTHKPSLPQWGKGDRVSGG